MTGQIIYGSLFVAVGLLALVNWWRKSSKRRTLLAIPIMPIASLRARQVSITGNVRSRNMELRSPLSDQRCVYYSFEVLRLVRTGKESSSWEAAISDSDSIDFQLEDETGSISDEIAVVVLSRILLARGRLLVKRASL